MLLSDCLASKCTKRMISGKGLEEHFAEVYLFQPTGFLQMAKAGYGTCCHIS